METVIAFTTKDAAVVCCDMSQNQDIFVLNLSSDKVHELFDKHLLTVSGDPGDSCSHTDHIKANLRLQYYQNNKRIPTVNACASYIREGIWEAVRDHQLKIKVCYAGIDSNGVPNLYTIDEYGALMQPKYIAQNYSMYFLLAVLDKYWREDLDKEGIIDLVKKCINVLARRFMLQQHKFMVKIATKNGIEKIVVDHRPEPLQVE